MSFWGLTLKGCRRIGKFFSFGLKGTKVARTSNKAVKAPVPVGQAVSADKTAKPEKSFWQRWRSIHDSSEYQLYKEKMNYGVSSDSWEYLW